MSDYKIIRRVEYPPINDFVEAVYDKEKGDDTKYKAWIAACDKVKNDFPK
tara:strand:- start:224 stop:373 length:150 start_codon:yes stop_codon:yes gene_type:complete